MSPTDLLAYEHRLIEQVLNCLERMMEESCRDGAFDEQVSREILGFLREYAEGIHLDREERFVFPLIAGKECPEGCDVRELLVRKHHESQQHLDHMETAAGRAASGNRDALKQFVEAGQSYVGLAMTYIEHEEDWLFRMIDRVLNDTEKRELRERLLVDSAQRPARRSPEDYASLADRLADRFGVRKTGLPSIVRIGQAD